MDDRVITINRNRVFTLAAARDVLPVIRRITAEFSQKVELMIARLEGLDPAQNVVVLELEGQVNELIKAWHEKIKKLGAVPKGLWLVDFDCGDGYFCWKFPETDILFWHDYQDGFTGRIAVEEYLQRRPAAAESNPMPAQPGGLDAL